MTIAAIVLAAIVVFGVLAHLICEFLVGRDFTAEFKNATGSLSEPENPDE